jgi:hypothetical protein
MVILRPTRKLRTLLPVPENDPGVSGTALGDWYVNRIVIDRRPLLLLVPSKSLLAVLAPGRDVRHLPLRLGDIVAQRLGRLGVAARVIDAELRAMEPVGLAKTVDRSVLGIMVDYAKMLRYDLAPGFSEHAALQGAEERLWDNPCYASRSSDEVVWPRKKTVGLLLARWSAG